MNFTIEQWAWIQNWVLHIESNPAMLYELKKELYEIKQQQRILEEFEIVEQTNA